MAEKYPLEFDQITDALKNFGQSHVIRVKARETATMYIVHHDSGEIRFPKLTEQTENGRVSDTPKTKGQLIRTHIPKLYVVNSKYAEEIKERNQLAKIADDVELAVRKMVQVDRFNPRIKEIAKIMGLLDGDSKNE